MHCLAWDDAFVSSLMFALSQNVTNVWFILVLLLVAPWGRVAYLVVPLAPVTSIDRNVLPNAPSPFSSFTANHLLF